MDVIPQPRQGLFTSPQYCSAKQQQQHGVH
jgi:hypothetical protein